ncbi:toxin-antitoxin system YwqK family antitoxin [Sphingobacterium sp.]|uniref:toxin-antitoxin system YwqK family antitoxin n=1 Tax=Sphingobacterium sp. TaxID=341027 RepID=UPI00289B440E|nr:toxin-antitoxin system YwqK family antitoxin [Sphingobacterium sp.]
MEKLLKSLLFFLMILITGNLIAQESTLLGKDYDYMKTYFNLKGTYTYETEKITDKMTLVTADLFDHKKDLIETRYYTFADHKGKHILEKLEILKPFTEQSWKSTVNSLIEQGYEETNYFLVELVAENSREQTPVYQSKNRTKDQVQHYMTISRFDDGYGMMSKAAFFLTTSEFQDYVATAKEHKVYYPNGKLRISTFVNERGYFQGDYKEFYENGKIKEIGVFKGKDRPEGEFRGYYEDGKLQVLSNYKNGQLDGKYEEYHQNGKLKMSGNYAGGKMDGEFKLYKDTGELSRKENYKSDVRIDQ